MSRLKASFLDLGCNVKQREFEIELYASFLIVRMPHRDSNYDHWNLFFATVGSEILHLARTTSSKEKFQKLITSLLTRM